MAITDKLTGVFNRQILDANLNLSIKDSLRFNKPFSIIIIDIDHFKNINDSYGHLTGDKALCHLTEIIKSIIRGSDILSRWGGDEFIMIINNCNLENALSICEKIRIKIKETKLNFEKNEIPITTSFGVTQFKSSDTENEIFSRVDRCLYLAKEKGRNRIEFL